MILKSKTEVRKVFRGRLDSRSEQVASETSAALCARLESCLDLGGTATETGKCRPEYWAAFHPTGYEPDIRALFSSSKLKTKIKWAFPRVEGEALEFYRPHGDERDSFVEGNWKLFEPHPEKADKVSLESLSGFLIPGLVFDKKCNRLGRGAGYYDRTLTDLHKTNPKAITVGIAVDLQISNEDLPAQPFDIPMDCVVTETRFFARERGGTSVTGIGIWADILSERKTL
jgi:5-formyltetrahydrofolate cyclo-ligase